MFFSAGYWSPDTGEGSVLQYELWRTDGTSAGTVEVGVINDQGGSARPKWLTAAGDWDAIGGPSQSLYFSADDGLHGRELWVYEP